MRFKVANYSRLEIRLDTLHIYNGQLPALPKGSAPVAVTVNYSYTISLLTQNLPFPEILPTIDPTPHITQDYLHGHGFWTAKWLVVFF